MAKIKIKTIEPYESVKDVSLNERDLNSRHGAQFFRNVKQLQVGYGSSVFRVDRDGMWAGAETFASAPWSVDWDGNMIANSVTLGGYLQDGEALGDIGVGNITGTYIADGAIITDKLAANAVTAAKISVGQLSAISADIGTVNAGVINGITITGGTIRTSSSSTRVEMNGSTNRLEVYQSGALRVSIEDDTISLRNSGGSIVGNLFAGTSNFFVQSTNNMEVSAASVLDLRGGTGSITVTSTGISMNEDLDMNNMDITDVDRIYLDDIYATGTEINVQNTIDMNNLDLRRVDHVSFNGAGSYIEDLSALYFDPRSSTPSSADGSIWYYNSGGTLEMRTSLGGTVYRFVLETP